MRIPSPTAPSRDGSLSAEYAKQLKKTSSVWWKRLLDVQAPYRWNLNRLRPGRVLDIGCGWGRNLLHVNGNGVGVDPNTTCVEVARDAGLTVYTPADFELSKDAKEASFDTILMAHVLEHLTPQQGVSLLRQYMPYLRPNGKVILITPQEAGYRSDATHLEFIDEPKLRSLAQAVGVEVISSYSFPFPRWFGNTFKYNEFVVVGLNRRAHATAGGATSV
jgi:2-polyprenyl-3-methyl-5-hydroxy-6-metoxy-1,4-benzoquinol methylase